MKIILTVILSFILLILFSTTVTIFFFLRYGKKELQTETKKLGSKNIAVTILFLVASVTLSSVILVFVLPDKSFTAFIFVVLVFLILVAGKEFWGAWNSGKEVKWISFYMLAAVLVILGSVIGLLEAYVPEWQSNLLNSKAGKISILLLLISGLGWYIMPGTGKITLSGAKWPIAILGIVWLILFINAALGKSEKQVAVVNSAPATVYTPPPEITYVPPRPVTPVGHWKEVSRTFVEYNRWSPDDHGWVTILDAPEEGARYKISIQESNFRMLFSRDEERVWRATPVGGIIGRYAAYQQELPLAGSNNNWIGARIIREGNAPARYLGYGMDFRSNGSPIKISINIMQDSPAGFVGNQGGDWVFIQKWVEP